MAAESYTLHELSCIAMGARGATGAAASTSAMTSTACSRRLVLARRSSGSAIPTIRPGPSYARRGRDHAERTPPRIAVVIDGAYAEYADDPEYGDGLSSSGAGYPERDRAAHACRRPMASPVCGSASRRLMPRICVMLDRLREPFNMSRVATAAGPAALADLEWLRHCQGLNRRGRDFLSGEFARLGFDVVPSQANFILVDVKQDANALFERLHGSRHHRPPGEWVGVRLTYPRDCWYRGAEQAPRRRTREPPRYGAGSRRARVSCRASASGLNLLHVAQATMPGPTRRGMMADSPDQRRWPGASSRRPPALSRRVLRRHRLRPAAVRLGPGRRGSAHRCTRRR